MTLSFRTTRTATSRYTPRFEALESRRLFAVSAGPALTTSLPIGPAALSSIPGGLDLDQSATPGDLSTLSVVQTTPASLSVLTKPPTDLNVVFNQPFPTYLVGLDIGLQRVDANGAVLENLTDLLLPSMDLPGQSSVLPLAINGVLAPGRYQIVLLGSTSQLSGLPVDGKPGAPLINSGQDQVVSTFTIISGSGTESPPTLASATDLGPIGPVPIVTSGSLNLGVNFSSSQFYKFTLTPGHFWRLGAEVTAQRDGGTLNSVLTLFDAEGRILKTDDLGRSDAPYDPYLFAGLQPGTYYLGVSNSPHVPISPGSPNSVDGNYRLHVVASIADTPTYLLDSQLIYSDPLDPRPTGIVLVFSGPMDLDSFKDSIGLGGNSGFNGLQLVDGNGQVWSLTPTSFKESNSQYSFLFSKPLPKGQYTLRVPALNGVTDLAGWTPVANGKAQTSLPNGVLTSWTVASDYSPQAANDLGTIMNDASTPATRAGTLAAGSSASYRFVVPADGYYTIESTASSESFLLQLSGSDGTTTAIQSGIGASLNSKTLYLNAGIYFLQCKATGSDRLTFRLSLFGKPVSPDAIFDNGVGQGPALNLTLITPIPLPPTNQGKVPDVAPAPGPAPAPDLAHPSPLAPTNPPTVLPRSTSTFTISSSSAANGLVLTLGSGLVGSPTAGAEHVSAVGPGTLAGTTALAANTPGVLQGIRYDHSLSPASANLFGESLLDPGKGALNSDDPLDSANDPSVANRRPVIANRAEREIASPSNWLGGIGTLLLHGFGLTSTSQTPIELEAAPSEPVAVEQPVLSSDGLVAAEPDERVVYANLAAPIGLSIVTVLAFRLQQPIRRWLERKRILVTKRRATTRPTVRGPYNRG
ncbi:PPC domain-containing protein [Singulisphaera acidiphila]|uniref:Uncharacterized protein n=1 Tax=Singulisphaera acidiphila (strain ATCC BAA-1392 / DSM 18658 / VKM B-2454 / MOB10) TaxID=886293 RepID=L0D9K1_SINAD|nr:PPC domain-containing protein [Singulisphaera acidiphila]AGA25508.1 hypothetical protein Sinac_1112 [Singulisphaera acidiphila DSM 18658]